MGVSGVGKTTVARLVAEHLGMPFVDADDLHSASNLAKMSNGIPLTDEDRMPWLHAVGDALGQSPASVIACSALKRTYRDVLREHAPNALSVMLDADPARLADQIARRRGHFMPPELLQSQLDALEPLQPDEAGIIMAVDDDPLPLARRIVSAL
ncbi:gluconokinase [Microbacterium esteraromaticum]|uniref:gluconokinase n=1 Tax=Microbacterium esteraromaticum TaxID=57043 RepID=UPI000B3614B2|nr:gluconokinase [Microbacterium esteraromaticum]